MTLNWEIFSIIFIFLQFIIANGDPFVNELVSTDQVDKESGNNRCDRASDDMMFDASETLYENDYDFSSYFGYNEPLFGDYQTLTNEETVSKDGSDIVDVDTAVDSPLPDIPDDVSVKLDHTYAKEDPPEIVASY